MHYWIAMGVFVTFVILERISVWVFIRGSEKHHPELWGDVGEPTIARNGNIIGSWSIIEVPLDKSRGFLSSTV